MAKLIFVDAGGNPFGSDGDRGYLDAGLPIHYGLKIASANYYQADLAANHQWLANRTESGFCVPAPLYLCDDIEDGQFSFGASYYSAVRAASEIYHRIAPNSAYLNYQTPATNGTTKSADGDLSDLVDAYSFQIYYNTSTVPTFAAWKSAFDASFAYVSDTANYSEPKDIYVWFSGYYEDAGSTPVPYKLCMQAFQYLASVQASNSRLKGVIIWYYNSTDSFSPQLPVWRAVKNWDEYQNSTTQFTEFFVNADTGDDMNAGGTDGAPLTWTGGSWDHGTGVFSTTDPTLAARITDGSVAVGMFASVFVDSSTTPNFIGRITAVNAGTPSFTVSLSAKIGTVPSTGAGTRSTTVGGAWKTLWALPTLTTDLVNTSGDPPCINIAGDPDDSALTINVTATVQLNGQGVSAEGYCLVPHDGGKAIIDAGGNAIDIFAVNGYSSAVKNLIIQNNASGSAHTGLSLWHAQAIGCVVREIGGNGVLLVDVLPRLIESEVYNCNKSSAGRGGVVFAGGIVHGGKIHHNTGWGIAGASFDCSLTVSKTIIAENDGGGIYLGDGYGINLSVIGCDFYNNGGNAIDASLGGNGKGTLQIANSNFLKNEGTILCSAPCWIYCCGFGSGTMANSGGDTTGPAQLINKLIYAADTTPWIDPDNGNFTTINDAAKGIGRAEFTEYKDGYCGTGAYADIGAAGANYWHAAAIKTFAAKQTLLSARNSVMDWKQPPI